MSVVRRSAARAGLRRLRHRRIAKPNESSCAKWLDRRDRDPPLRPRNRRGRRFVCRAGKLCPPEAVPAGDQCAPPPLRPEKPSRNRLPKVPVFSRPKALRSSDFADSGKVAAGGHPTCAGRFRSRGCSAAVLQSRHVNRVQLCSNPFPSAARNAKRTPRATQSRRAKATGKSACRKTGVNVQAPESRSGSSR